ncbi:hypothetical protein [Oryza sativa Japonica Group]|uniref:Uncharacterized protein n=1 Tax=Oryza sativa subsp. japonica TaxID=39947 RepID=Q9FYN6_ORYSJ|nr:hypothetical protein [Oryza sativa Japonica Group]
MRKVRGALSPSAQGSSPSIRHPWSGRRRTAPLSANPVRGAPNESKNHQLPLPATPESKQSSVATAQPRHATRRRNHTVLLFFGLLFPVFPVPCYTASSAWAAPRRPTPPTRPPAVSLPPPHGKSIVRARQCTCVCVCVCVCVAACLPGRVSPGKKRKEGVAEALLVGRRTTRVPHAALSVEAERVRTRQHRVFVSHRGDMTAIATAYSAGRRRQSP